MTPGASNHQKNIGTSKPILCAEGLEKSYPNGQVRALQGVSLSIQAGEFVAITGPSGCGKTTLLHVLGGLDRPDRGEVRFRGRPLADMNLDAYRALEIGFVFQSFHLLPTLSALQNVQIPMFEAPWPVTDRAARAERLLAQVGLEGRRHHVPSALSIGERQRAAIARAMANEPALILADEPTGNLDSATQDDILGLLGLLRTNQGLTLVVVTHSPEVAAASDRRIRMRDGRLIDS